MKTAPVLSSLWPTFCYCHIESKFAVEKLWCRPLTSWIYLVAVCWRIHQLNIILQITNRTCKMLWQLFLGYKLVWMSTSSLAGTDDCWLVVQLKCSVELHYSTTGCSEGYSYTCIQEFLTNSCCIA